MDENILAGAVKTPFFAYDLRKLSRHSRKFKTRLNEKGIRLKYSLKANSHPSIVANIIADGFDVTSLDELRVALSVTTPDKISVTGPAKSGELLLAASKLGCLITVESGLELRKLGQLEHLRGARVALRLNPDFKVRGGQRMGGLPSQFGIDVEDSEEIRGGAGLYDQLGHIKFEGYHCYPASQILDAETLMAIHTQTFEMMYKLDPAASYINVGGGFGIDYTTQGRELELMAVVDNLGELKKRYFPHAEVWVESGRYIVGECGSYVTSVVDVKKSRGTTFAVVDGGMNHVLAASGNLGMIVRNDYPHEIFPKTGREIGEFSVVGNLCTPLDMLVKKGSGTIPQIGSIVVIKNVGAYGKQASPLDFLSHEHPKEYFYK